MTPNKTYGTFYRSIKDCDIYNLNANFNPDNDLNEKNLQEVDIGDGFLYVFQIVFVIRALYYFDIEIDILKETTISLWEKTCTQQITFKNYLQCK